MQYCQVAQRMKVCFMEEIAFCGNCFWVCRHLQQHLSTLLLHNAIICGIDHLQHKNALSMSDQFCKGCVLFHDPDTLVNPREKGYCVPH